jgi:hypothetical protein
MTAYRVNYQRVYRDDGKYLGVMFTAEDAALVVKALNALPDPDRCESIRPGGTDRCDLAKGHEGGHQVRSGLLVLHWPADR